MLILKLIYKNFTEVGDSFKGFVPNANFEILRKLVTLKTNTFRLQHLSPTSAKLELKSLLDTLVVITGQSIFGTSNFGTNLWTSTPNVNFSTKFD